MDPSTIYNYSKITREGGIRLLLLQPSQNLEAIIKCSLFVTTIEECDHDITEHYVALSYVWGDATKRSTILVEGKHLSITAPLDCALRHIRDGHRVLRV
jgi:hypothetical protein